LISFIALQFLKAQQVQAIFMALASCSDTSQDHPFWKTGDPPSTIALAFEQLGLIPAKV